jgi:multimeric flavodoxin WrbA
MKILGISGSSRDENISGTFKLVKTVLENTGIDYELISLKGKNISGCISCLKCAKDNICSIKDDLYDLRDKIIEADAYVIGAPNFYNTLNALTHAFIERWYQFRHQAGDTLWGKLAVAVGVGGSNGDGPVNDLERFFMYSFIETVAKVSGQGAAACFTCGYGETCDVGIPRMMMGENVKITPDIIPSVTRQPELIKAAEEAGKLLGERLTTGHDRKQVASGMQKKLMDMFTAST